MKCTEETDSTQTTIYVIYESLSSSEHGSDNKGFSFKGQAGFTFIGLSIEACIQALKHYAFTKLIHNESVIVQENIEHMLNDDIPLAIKLAGEETYFSNPYLVQVISFKARQGEPQMTKEQFYNGLDKIMARFECIAFLDSVGWGTHLCECPRSISSNTKDLIEALIRSESPFSAAQDSRCSQRQQAQVEDAKPESPKEKAEQKLFVDGDVAKPESPKEKAEQKLLVVSDKSGNTAKQAEGGQFAGTTQQYEETMARNIESFLQVAPGVKDEDVVMQLLEQNNNNVSDALAALYRDEERENKEWAKNKVGVDWGEGEGMDVDNTANDDHNNEDANKGGENDSKEEEDDTEGNKDGGQLHGDNEVRASKTRATVVLDVELAGPGHSNMKSPQRPCGGRKETCTSLPLSSIISPHCLGLGLSEFIVGEYISVCTIEKMISIKCYHVSLLYMTDPTHTSQLESQSLNCLGSTSCMMQTMSKIQTMPIPTMALITTMMGMY